MRLVVLRSRKSRSKEPVGTYSQTLDTRFADKVLGNLRDRAGYCNACGPDCNRCRKPYAERFRPDIAAVIDLPHRLPYVLENPASFVPEIVPPHDVLLAIGIHEQILLETVKACLRWETKGLVVPLEAPDWIRGATRAEIHGLCEANGVEVSFPKPFCAFRPPLGGVLAEFRESFHIGCPDVQLTIEQGRITNANVRVSAACGATYCVARWLVGRTIDENLEIEVVSRRWHAFPCTASMERDPELNDETPLHMAGQAHYAILAPYKAEVAGLEEPYLASPHGKRVQRPLPPEEYLRNIENAKDLILDELRVRSATTLADLRRKRDVNPAAMNSALLILKKERKIRTDGARIYPCSTASGNREKAR